MRIPANQKWKTSEEGYVLGRIQSMEVRVFRIVGNGKRKRVEHMLESHNYEQIAHEVSRKRPVRPETLRRHFAFAVNTRPYKKGDYVIEAEGILGWGDDERKYDSRKQGEFTFSIANRQF